MTDVVVLIPPLAIKSRGSNIKVVDCELFFFFYLAEIGQVETIIVYSTLSTW